MDDNSKVGLAFALATAAKRDKQRHVALELLGDWEVSIFRFGDGWKAVFGTTSAEEERGRLWATRPAADPIEAIETLLLIEGKVSSEYLLTAKTRAEDKLERRMLDLIDQVTA